MIFVTVGTQLPFDRMVRTVDAWAASAGRDDVFAQIGSTDYRPQHLQFKASITPVEFAHHARAASVIIAHAGMGSILTALEFGKPIVIMPRLARLREQRNDHQLATCQRFGRTPGIHVAADEQALTDILLRVEALHSGEQIGPFASAGLIETIRSFIRAAPELHGRLSAADRTVAP